MEMIALVPQRRSASGGAGFARAGSGGHALAGHAFRIVLGAMASSRRRPRPQPTQDVTLDQRLHQARRQRRRGDERKALLILREVCFQAASDARLWTLYAHQCWRTGRRDDACQALRQALWLREKARDEARARVLRALLSAAETSQAQVLKAA